MSKTWKAFALAALALGALSVQAGKANATEGWYGRVDAGYSVDGELDFDAPVGSADLDNDWMASGGVGYAFSNGVRLEGELGHRTNDISDSGVNTDANSLMANVYYDFNRTGRIAPYVGVGAGYGRVNVDGLGHDSGVAYQAMAGVGVKLTPQLALDIGYRYFTIRDLDYKASGTRKVTVCDGEEFCSPELVPFSYKVGGDYEHQAVTVGLRYQFAAPVAPAAPAPVPAPTPAPVAVCPQSDFVVYFEWDRSDLNAQANEVIDSAITRAHECNVTAATVIGHTDTSGSTAYNIALSERRAAVVRDAMAARGLDTSLITTQAHGESDLARMTADGVREPLNRRTAVTITFH